MKRTLTIYRDGQPFGETRIIEVFFNGITTTFGTFSRDEDEVWRLRTNPIFTIKPEA